MEKSNVFLDFSKYCGKVWENPNVFLGFFHAFPQYGISMKHATEQKKDIFLPTNFFEDPTFFTYSFSRLLAEEFIESPPTGWIPLRFSIRDLGQYFNSKRLPKDAEDFRKDKLEELGVSIAGWKELLPHHNILVILDGFDEMSKKLDPESIAQNSEILIALYKEFNGAKLIITSRKHFFEEQHQKEELLKWIGNPEIIQIAPISKRETINHLYKCCEGPEEKEKKEKLNKIRKFHDPIGLAQKPLFLQMIKENIRDLPETNLDVVILYNYYVESTLRRKVEDLKPEDIRKMAGLTREQIVKNMLKSKFQEARDVTCLAAYHLPGTNDYLVGWGDENGRIHISQLSILPGPFKFQYLLFFECHEGKIKDLEFITEDRIVSIGFDKKLYYVQFDREIVGKKDIILKKEPLQLKKSWGQLIYL